MGLTLKNAYIGQPVNTGVDAYTCPANITARVLKCTATNDTTTAETLTVHKIPSGGSVGDDNLIMNAKTIGSKKTDECPEVVGQVLEAGDIIHFIPSASNQITISLDVVEATV